MNKYTVIGYWMDDHAPIVARVRAASPQAACSAAMSVWPEKKDAIAYDIIAVFEGHPGIALRDTNAKPIDVPDVPADEAQS